MAFVLHGRLDGYLLLTIFLVTCLIAFGENVSFPEATIPQGTVRGVNMETHRGRTVYGFIGVPYAQPPVGDLRFKEPLPPTAWNGTLEASTDTPACLGMYSNKVDGDEDCLYINVFTPQLPTNETSTLLPVIFYILGGAFQRGSNTIRLFNPDYLLDKDVILVVPTFRVGVLGFLSTGDRVSPGNNGMKDIVRALEWIRDNIQYFGGDPDRVTLTGSSSGAMTVSLLLMSDSTEGLFHQFMQDGGAALLPDLQEPNEMAVERAIRLGAHLGCPTNTSTDMVDCLRSLNASRLVDTISVFEVSELVLYTPWRPTAEPDVEGAFLTKSPAELFASGKIRDLPSIRSNVRDEGLASTSVFYADEAKFSKLLDNFDYLGPYLMGYTDATENVKAYTTTMTSHYINDFNASNRMALTNLTQMVGDALFVYPLYKELNQYVALAKSPQYYSVFDYRGVFSYSYDHSGGYTGDIGVAHGDELIYVFRDHANSAGPASWRFSEADWKMVDIMVELWTSFAINGVPNAKDANGKNIWEPYSSSRNYLRIGNGKEPVIDVQYGWKQPQMDFIADLEATIETGVNGKDVEKQHF